jgi:hypothetical protein
MAVRSGPRRTRRGGIETFAVHAGNVGFEVQSCPARVGMQVHCGAGSGLAGSGGRSSMSGHSGGREHRHDLTPLSRPMREFERLEWVPKPLLGSYLRLPP